MNAQSLREALRGVEEGTPVSIEDRNGTKFDITTITAAGQELVILVAEKEETEEKE